MKSQYGSPNRSSGGSRFRRIAILFSTASLLSAGVVVGVPTAAHAAVNIGVAPSPNGLVMAGVPTQIAISGAPRATIYLWDASQSKYFRIGAATNKAALPFTFTQNGLAKIKVVPAGGRPKTFQIPVYNRFSFFSTTPTTYGGVILTSFRDGWATKATAPAKAGCVLADIGVKDGSASRPRGITIQSTGANPVTLTATDVAGVGQQGIPVKGDIVVQGSSGGDADKFGVVLTCLFNW